jgi:hypothetical protein
MSLSAFTTYISVLKNYKYIGHDTGREQLNTLRQFADKHYISTWDVSARLEVDYRNIHKRVMRLQNLEFIEPVVTTEVKEKDNKHGAKYYRITEAGMFQLFFKIGIIDTLFETLQTNANYLIFEALLYPCFEKRTFTALNKIAYLEENRFFNTQDIKLMINFRINEYLRLCCIEIQKLITSNEFRADEDLEWSDYVVSYPRGNLIMNLLAYFKRYKDSKESMNVLAILAQDDKFMKKIYNIHNGLNRCFDFAMQLRTGPSYFLS